MRTQRFWVAVLFGSALASACGRSARDGGGPLSSEAGASGGWQPEGGSSAGKQSDAGTSSGGVSVAGAPEMAGQAGMDSVTAGAAGTAGESGVGGSALGGAGGAGDEPLPSPVCDDGNSCTIDRYGPAGCQHDHVPDGQLCEDGSFCTLGDRCLAGACVPGAAQNEPGSALGELHTYGSGLAVSPGGSRFAFVDAPAIPARLTLAEVDAQGVLQTRDEVSVDQNVGASFIGTAWDDVIALADGATSFGLNGPSRNLQLFSIEANASLTPHAVVPITPGSAENPANASLIGRGSRLFLCHNWSFFTPPAGTLMWWDVSDLDVPVLVAQGSTKGQCGSLAVSEDGSRVYVNTVNGVLWTDLSTWSSGDLAFAAEPLVANDAGLSLRGDRLVARSGELIRVFDESDHALLESFTVPGANGVALMEAGILVQSDVSSGGGTENRVALHALSGELIQTVTVSKLAYARDIASQKAVASGTYAIDAFTRRMFAVADSGFDEVEQPRVGALSWAFAGQDEALHTRGNLAAHRIDINDPHSPVVLAGGPTREPVLGIKLDVSLAPASLVAETDPSPVFFSGPDPATVAVNAQLGHGTQTLVQTVSASADERYETSGTFALPGGDATLLSAGDFVYRAAYEPAGGVHFQRWHVSDLQAGVRAPAMDLEFDAPAGAAGSTTVRFDVDANARSAVVTTSWVEASVLVGKLHWIDLATEPPSVLETMAGNAVGVKVRGDRVAYLENTTTGTKFHFRTRGSESDANLEVSSRITRLLGFDGTTVYYAVQNLLGAVTNRPAGPAVTLGLPMRGTPSSLVAMPGALVATSAAQLLTLAPVCD